MIYRTNDIGTAIRLGVTHPTAAIVATAISGIHWTGSIPIEDVPVARHDRVVALEANVDHLAIVEGVIEPAADGILRLQYAPEVTGAIVTVRRGSAGVLQAT